MRSFDIMITVLTSWRISDLMTYFLTSRQIYWRHGVYFWRHDVFLMAWCMHDVTSWRTYWRTLWRHNELFDAFAVMTNFLTYFLMLWRIFYVMTHFGRHDELYNVMKYFVMTNVLTSCWTFRHHDELSDVMTYFWRHDVILSLWRILTSWRISDVMTKFSDVITCFWCHDKLLTCHTFDFLIYFGRHDVFFDVMTHFDVMTNLWRHDVPLTSYILWLTFWRTFWHCDILGQFVNYGLNPHGTTLKPGQWKPGLNRGSGGFVWVFEEWTIPGLDEPGFENYRPWFLLSA